jgi:2-amino-4-hydroxy-6-hydroxymethyldihydropteridine diphosphokinase
MRQSGTVRAFVALGANTGKRASTLFAAVANLSQTPGVTITRISNLFENPAVGGPPDAPPFLNAAAGLETTLGAHALLHRLLQIERELGRVRRTKWEPRPIDLDLLLYGDSIFSGQDLLIPHPLMHERRFVLQPLAEIAPEAVHPALQMTIAGLLENLDRETK